MQSDETTVVTIIASNEGSNVVYVAEAFEPVTTLRSRDLKLRLRFNCIPVRNISNKASSNKIAWRHPPV